MSNKRKPTAMVIFDFKPETKKELALKKGETIVILKHGKNGWWEARNKKGGRGWIPQDFVRVIPPPDHPEIGGGGGGGTTAEQTTTTATATTTGANTGANTGRVRKGSKGRGGSPSKTGRGISPNKVGKGISPGRGGGGGINGNSAASKSIMKKSEGGIGGDEEMDEKLAVNFRTNSIHLGSVGPNGTTTKYEPPTLTPFDVQGDYVSLISEPPAEDDALRDIHGDKVYVRALFAYTAKDPTQLNLTQGTIIEVVSTEGVWWLGKTGEKRGFFPSNFTEPYQPEEMMPHQTSTQPELPTPPIPGASAASRLRELNKPPILPNKPGMGMGGSNHKPPEGSRRKKGHKRSGSNTSSGKKARRGSRSSVGRKGSASSKGSRGSRGRKGSVGKEAAGEGVGGSTRKPGGKGKGKKKDKTGPIQAAEAANTKWRI